VVEEVVLKAADRIAEHREQQLPDGRGIPTPDVEVLRGKQDEIVQARVRDL
jgi:hypothetical protein